MTHRAGPQGARRQAGRGRSLPHRHGRAGRHASRRCGPAPTARWPAPSCMSCSRKAMPTGTTSRATPTRRTSWKRISRSRTPEWAASDHRPAGGADRRLRAALRRHQAQLHPLGYGFSAQRNGAVQMHAVTCLPAVTGAWQYEGGGALYGKHGIYPHRPHADRGARSARPLDPHARPVAPRADPDRRPARSRRRAAGHGAVHPEHQPDGGLARIDAGAQGLRARRPVRLRARAVHDRDGGDGRHRAAGDDVPRARRHLHRGRPHLSAGRPRRCCRPMPNAARTTM